MAKVGALLVVCSVLASLSKGSAETEWTLFKQRHARTYESIEIDTLRKEIFLLNKKIVDKFNADESEKLGFRLGLNHLSDRTDDEMNRLNGLRISEEEKPALQNSVEAQSFLASILENNSTEVPDELDWRSVPGRVSAVKNQGWCGSCWAFATTGVLEGQEAVRNRSLASGSPPTELSEQNLIDCSPKPDDGCFGGFMTHALTFIRDQGGIDSEEAYPYEGLSIWPCRFKADGVAFTDSGWAGLPHGDEQRLKEFVAKFGPVSAAIHVTPILKHYSSGVLDDRTCLQNRSDLNHGVLVVGYGIDQSLGDYWIVKNSWGPQWGEQGYIRMSRNKGNQCGIATVPIIPTF